MYETPSGLVLSDEDSFAYTPDGQFLVAVGYPTLPTLPSIGPANQFGCQIHVWDAETGSLIASHEPAINYQNAFAISPSGFLIAVATDAGISFLNLNSGDIYCNSTFPIHLHGRPVYEQDIAFDWSPDERYFAAVNVRGQFQLLNARSGMVYGGDMVLREHRPLDILLDGE